MPREQDPMGTGNLKHKATTSFFWKFSERLCANVVTLLVSIVLARLLTPDDYSVVGITTIFYAFAKVFIQGGLTSALVQNKNVTMIDYATVLWFSVGMSIVMYLILFFCAPLIAGLYGKPLLVPVLRVLGVSLLINAVKAVVCCNISKRLDFRQFFFATIVGTVISAVVGIWMAYRGYGPWALVAQKLINASLDTIILYLVTRLRIPLAFSKDSFKRLFGFGFRMMLSSFINTAYDEVAPLFIGIKYTPTDLAFYSKGKSIPYRINKISTDTFSAVLFPTLSKLQDDKARMRSYLQSFMEIGSFVLYPLMIGFMAVGESFVRIVLTEKWLPSVYYIRFFCTSYMIAMLSQGNTNAIYSMGRSDIYLKLQLKKRIVGFSVMASFLFLTKSPQQYVWVSVINAVIFFIFNGVENKKLLNYSLFMQIRDVLPALLMSFVMGVPVFLMKRLPWNILILFPAQVLTGAAIYVALALIFKPNGYKKAIHLIKSFIEKKKARQTD